MKKIKPQVFYQAVNSEGIPVEIYGSYWYGYSVKVGNSKPYCSASMAARYITAWISAIKEGGQIAGHPGRENTIDDKIVSEDEIIHYLLSCKICVLRPMERLDLEFYLDKLK